MFAVFDLTPGAWAVLVVGALLIGVAKTALPGLATISVAMFAAVIPARESTAVMLLLLMIGDVIAVWTYRRNVDWAALRRLVPAVLVGVLLGTGVLGWIDDAAMKRMIGVILLTLTAVTLWLMWWSRRRSPLSGAGGFGQSRIARWIYGGLGGFTTMVANAGGPPMTLYFMASGFDMVRFIGTQAWFFFLVNLTKAPLQASLGLYSTAALGTDLLLAAAVILGAWAGRVLIKRMNPEIFNPLVLGLTVVSSVYLLV